MFACVSSWKGGCLRGFFCDVFATVTAGKAIVAFARTLLDFDSSRWGFLTFVDGITDDYEEEEEDSFDFTVIVDRLVMISSPFFWGLRED